ncbi:MAG: T9SS type A sorting domain-containing protein [Ignavibacteriae bacterium]|nr:T9SS type A sorting domain-containing protein [Ignavibacteriota bacterium]
MKNSFLLSIVTVGFLLGNVGLSTAQQMKIIPGQNVAPVAERSVSAAKVYLPNSPDESTPIAPFSKKEIKSLLKKNKNSNVLGGDKKITANMPGIKIGYTYYDFQTNNAMPERIAYYDDQTNKFTQMFWMAAKDSSRGNSGVSGQLDAPGFNSSRGAHYAFIDVTNPDSPVNQYDTWEKMEAEKIGGQPERRGWPSIVQFNDGSVGTPSHTPVDFFKSSDYGDNTFTRTSVDKTTSTWPRAAVDGKDIVHVIYNTNASSTGTDQTSNLLCYRRSTDKGKTWEPEKIFTNNAFDATNGNFPYGAGGDSYAIAARGNNVVVLYGRFPNSDAFYRKSTDNGETWTLPTYAFRANYTGVDTSFYDADSARILTDTVAASGDQLDVVLDSEGKAHFVFNLAQSYVIMTGTHQTINGKDSVRVGLNTYGNLDELSDYQDANLGFGYYKEGDNFIYYIARPSTLGWNGTGSIISRRAASGLCRYPQLGLDEQNNVYLTFTSIKNDDLKSVAIDTTIPSRDGIADVQVDGLMGHIYVTHRLGGDANPNWSNPKDITPEGVDCLFGTLCNKVINGRMYIGYSADATPGDRVTNVELPIEQTEIYMYPFPTSSLNSIPPVGVEEEAAANEGLALTSQPNPTSGVTVFGFTAPQSGNATVTITNALGMNVATLYNGMLTAGATHSVNFDAQNLSSGAYYATLEINGRKVTKMVTIVK